MHEEENSGGKPPQLPDNSNSKENLPVVSNQEGNDMVERSRNPLAVIRRAEPDMGRVARENPNYDVWAFEGLVNVREQLGEMDGEHLSSEQKDVLEAVNEEINGRLKEAKENGELDFLTEFNDLGRELVELREEGAGEDKVKDFQNNLIDSEKRIWNDIEEETIRPGYLGEVQTNQLRKFALKRYANEMHEQVNQSFPDVEPMDSFEEEMGMDKPGTEMVRRSPGEVVTPGSGEDEPDVVNISFDNAGGGSGNGGGGGNETVSGAASPEGKEPSEMSVAEVRRQIKIIQRKKDRNTATDEDDVLLGNLRRRRQELLDRAWEEMDPRYMDAVEDLEGFRQNFDVMMGHGDLGLSEVLGFKNGANKLISEARSETRRELNENADDDLAGIREDILRYGYVNDEGEYRSGFNNGILNNLDGLVEQSRVNAEQRASGGEMSEEMLGAIQALRGVVEGLQQAYLSGGMDADAFQAALAEQSRRFGEVMESFGEKTPPFIERSRWVDMEYRQEFYTQFDPRSEPYFYKNMADEQERRVWDYRWRLARISYYKQVTNAQPDKYKESQDVTRFTNEHINTMLERVEGTKEMMGGYVEEVLDPDSVFWRLVREEKLEDQDEDDPVQKMNTERFDAYRAALRRRNRDAVIVRMSNKNDVWNMLSQEARDELDGGISNYQKSDLDFQMGRLNREQVKMIINDFKKQFVISSDQEKLWDHLSDDLKQKLDTEHHQEDNPLGLTEEQREDSDNLLSNLAADQINAIYEDIKDQNIDTDVLGQNVVDRISELTHEIKEQGGLVNGVSVDEFIDLKIKEADAVAWNIIYVSNLVEWADSADTISGGRHAMPLILASDDYRSVHHPLEKWISKSWSGHEGWGTLVPWSSYQLRRIAEETGRTEPDPNNPGSVRVKKANEEDFIYELAEGPDDFWKYEETEDGKLKVSVPAAFAPTTVDSFFHQSGVITTVWEKDESQPDGYAHDEHGRLVPKRDENGDITRKVDLDKFRTFRPDTLDTEAEHPFGLWVATRFDKALQFNEIPRGGLELNTSKPVHLQNVDTTKWAKKIIELHNRLDLGRRLTPRQIMDMNNLMFIASTEGAKDPSKKVPESLTYIDSARKRGIKATLNARGLSVDFKTNIFS